LEQEAVPCVEDASNAAAPRDLARSIDHGDGDLRSDGRAADSDANHVALLERSPEFGRGHERSRHELLPAAVIAERVERDFRRDIERYGGFGDETHRSTVRPKRSRGSMGG